MKESAHIAREEVLPPGQNFSELLNEGIAFTQQLAGDVWTDYNEHDPGLTILEQLCYALTDVGYRAAFDVRDLLAGPFAPSDPGETTLFTGDQILTCAPLTLLDYRKLLYDSVQGVKQAWLVPDHRTPIEGLYRVLLEPYEAYRSPVQCERMRCETWEVLTANRNLTEDFAEVRVADFADVLLEAHLDVDTDPSAESILADLLYDVQAALAPAPRLVTVDQRFQEGVPPDEIFEGPLLSLGLVDDDSLVALPDQVDLDRVLRALRGVEGVINVDAFSLSVRRADGTVDRLSESKPAVRIDEGRIPRLYPNIFDTWHDDPPYRITLQHGGRAIDAGQIDWRRVHRKVKEHGEQLLRGEVLARRTMMDADYRRVPRGEDRHVIRYDSIQNGFPLTYGIGPYGVPTTYLHDVSSADAPPDGAGPAAIQVARAARTAQSRQLKAYLLLFEQVVANYFAQLAHVPELFALSPTLSRTYFTQAIYSVPGAASVLKHGASLRFKELHAGMIVHVEEPAEPTTERAAVEVRVLTHDEAHDAGAGTIDDVREGSIVVDGITYRVTSETKIYRSYKTELDRIMASFDAAVDRRNAFATHLLARFNESFDDEALDRLDTRLSGKKDAFHWELVRSKLGYLRDYVSLSKRRGIGFEYLRPFGAEVRSQSNTVLLYAHGLGSEAERERRIEEILRYGVDIGNYVQQERTYGGKAIVLNDGEGMPIAHVYGTFFMEEEAVALKRTAVRYVKGLRAGDAAYDGCLRRFPAAAWPFDSGLENRARHLLNIARSEGSDEDVYVVEHVLLRPQAPTRDEQADERDVLFEAELATGESEYERRKAAEVGVDALARWIGRLTPESPYVRRVIAPGFSVSPVYPEAAPARRRHEEGRATRYGVRIIDEYAVIRLSVYGLKSRAEQSQRIADILSYGADPANYRLERRRHGEYRLVLYKTRTVEVDDTFYSYRLSAFLPSWPERFQQPELRTFATHLLRENSPAHVALDTYWLDKGYMQTFKRLHQAWVQARALWSTEQARYDAIVASREEMEAEAKAVREGGDIKAYLRHVGAFADLALTLAENEGEKGTATPDATGDGGDTYVRQLKADPGQMTHLIAELNRLLEKRQYRHAWARFKNALTYIEREFESLKERRSYEKNKAIFIEYVGAFSRSLGIVAKHRVEGLVADVDAKADALKWFIIEQGKRGGQADHKA